MGFGNEMLVDRSAHDASGSRGPSVATLVGVQPRTGSRVNTDLRFHGWTQGHAGGGGDSGDPGRAAPSPAQRASSYPPWPGWAGGHAHTLPALEKRLTRAERAGNTSLSPACWLGQLKITPETRTGQGRGGHAPRSERGDIFTALFAMRQLMGRIHRVPCF